MSAQTSNSAQSSNSAQTSSDAQASNDAVDHDTRDGAAEREPHLAPEESTRDRVLHSVMMNGPITAAKLGKELGHTAAAIRRHLDKLEEEGLIEVKEMGHKPSRAGRPARHYVVNPQGQSQWGSRNADVAIKAISRLYALGGERAVEEFARELAREQEARYTAMLEGTEKGPERIEALARALAADGYMGFTRDVSIPTGRTPMRAKQICQAHCPVVDIAAAVPAICDAETEMFQRVLGVDVRRLSTMAAGGHVCTTHVPVERGSAGRGTPVPREKVTRVAGPRRPSGDK